MIQPRTNTTTYDTVIVGQGLAGSLLAWQLIQNKQRVLIIDNGHISSASRPAAGLLNPVTGQRLVKSRHVDEYLPVAISMYKALEDFFGKTFFYPKKMLRLLKSDKELPALEKRKADSAYHEYLGEQFPPNHNAMLKDSSGSFQQLHTGYLDTVSLLDTLSDFFQQNGSYHKEQITPEDIHLSDHHVQIKELTTQKLIFCEGYKATVNPWFSWLPFKPAKGEILTLKTEDKLPDEIINAGKWLLPTENGYFKVGATYQWDPLDEQTTTEARDELLGFMNDLFRDPVAYELVLQKAGVRPCTKDTEPFTGLHPKYPRLGIFNGFGSKGSLTIPYHAIAFTDYLQGSGTLMPEADIQRHWNHNDS